MLPIAETEENREILDRARRLVGDKRICDLRDGKRCKFFVATKIDTGELVVEEVTGIIARVAGLVLGKSVKRDKQGWICGPNPGYSISQYLSETYYDAMGLPIRSTWQL